MLLSRDMQQRAAPSRFDSTKWTWPRVTIELVSLQVLGLKHSRGLRLHLNRLSQTRLRGTKLKGQRLAQWPILVLCRGFQAQKLQCCEQGANMQEAWRFTLWGESMSRVLARRAHTEHPSVEITSREPARRQRTSAP